MKPLIFPIVAAAFLIATLGCASHTAVTPFNVVVRGSSSSCTLAVDDRIVTTAELLEIARPEAKSRRRAQINWATEETPYRCVGGAIYALQLAGFKDVATPAEPLQ